MDKFTKQQIALLVGGRLVVTMLAIWGTWIVVKRLAPSDPRDPLTKAGGLAPSQDIRAK